MLFTCNPKHNNNIVLLHPRGFLGNLSSRDMELGEISQEILFPLQQIHFHRFPDSHLVHLFASNSQNGLRFLFQFCARKRVFILYQRFIYFPFFVNGDNY